MSTFDTKNGFFEKQALVALSLILIAGSFISAHMHGTKCLQDREQIQPLEAR